MNVSQRKKVESRKSPLHALRTRFNRFGCEPLEDRRMLTLLGLTPSLPLITYDSNGITNYTTTTSALDITATPLLFKGGASFPTRTITAPRSLDIHIQVDSSGNLIGGTPGDDLVITGNVVNPDGNPMTADDAHGVLLTGEVTGFGWEEDGATDQLDFRFTPTGGALLAYWSGLDIYVVTSIENSTFNADFTQNFGGGAKGNVNGTEALGSIQWEKRDASNGNSLLAGASFSVSGPTSSSVTDNGPGDVDPTPGVIKVANLVQGSYTITETAAPTGYSLDPNSRSVTLTPSNLYASIGTMGSDDVDDFHDSLGSITWEKRDASNGNILQGGATFSVNGPTSLTVVDDGAGDADPTPGVIKVANLFLGSYTITETVAPAGYSLDPNPRSATITSSNLDVVIGTASQNDSDDFHDSLGSIIWEKRDASNGNTLQGGATFSVSGPTSLSVTDNGANDADPTPGIIKVANVALGSYTITETVAPTGYALDPSPRFATVSAATLDVAIGAMGADDSDDFHDSLGSIQWEKRDASNGNILQGGATFSVSGPTSLSVIDNGANDADPAAGVIKVNNVLLGSYTITETVAPSGYSLDGSPRSVTVSDANLNASIGTMGANDSDDFHDSLGSIQWEKRDASNGNILQGGATFSVSGPTSLSVVDNGANDADPTAGEIKVINLALGSYTITETVAPSGYSLDSAPRSVTVSNANLNATLGTMGANDSSDFHDSLGSVQWEKRDASSGNILQGGATFSVSGPTSLTVVDNGANDADPTAGEIKVINLALGSYTITETVAPAGYSLDPAPRSVTISNANLNATLGTMGVNDSSDFHDSIAGSIKWEKRDASNNNVLLGGATFSVSGPTSLTVVDNGANDADPTAGVIKVVGLPLGSYSITETIAPAGYSRDTASRTVLISSASPNGVIGTMGVNDNYDFHDCLGSIMWEKRDATNGNCLQGGATFTVSPNPFIGGTGNLVVVDNGPYDSDPTAGEIKILKVALGTYTVTETVAPAGYSLDTAPRTITVSQGNLNPSIGTPGYNDSYDFHDVLMTGKINGKKWEDKTGNGLTTADDTPMAGVKIYLDNNDNGVWDTTEPYRITAADGTYSFTGLAAGTYIVREVVPTGFVRTNPTTSDKYTVNLAAGGTSSGNDFANAEICDMSIVSNIVYVINGTTPVTDLRGNTHEGDTVEVSFTVVAGAPQHRLTLVSYTAPSAVWDPNLAYQQQIFDIDTGLFGPGNYTLSVTIPHSFYQVDFICGCAIDRFGPAGSNITYGAQGRLFSADNGGTHALLSTRNSVSGFVYRDANNDGVKQSTERGIAGATVVLSGTTTQTVVTDAYGQYTFDNLPNGTYTITETTPPTYTDGKETLGNKGGTVGADKFTGISLSAGAVGTNYNFGECQTNGSAVAGNQTGSFSYWYGSSGQALVKALNGGASSLNLGNWLASNFNNLFGANSGTGNNLAGKTTTQVAAYYQALYLNSAKKLEAETLALALGAYVTNSSLAGTTATSYGFAVSSTGLGAATANVGSSGAAFGVSNNTVLTINELLSRANARTKNGLMWDTNASATLDAGENAARAQALLLFDSINAL